MHLKYMNSRNLELIENWEHNGSHDFDSNKKKDGLNII